MLAAYLNMATQEVQVAEKEVSFDSCKVKLSHAALNHRDVWITKGMYPGIKDGIILGSDGVGTYDGRGVIINPGLDWGDNEQVQSAEFRVLGMPDHGTFAEYIDVDEKYIYDKPDHLTAQEAAALPLAGVTAYRALMVRCQAQKEDKVLINGIGGGVALFAAQMAIALGCEVYVTSGSQSKIDQAMNMGATGGAIYKEEDWAKTLGNQVGGFDVIIDSAGGDGFNNLVKLCKPGARIGFYGGGRGAWKNVNPQLLFWRQVSIYGSTMGSDADFKSMLNFVSQHKIKPVVDSVFSLHDIQDAFSRMEKGDQFGKIVVEIP